MATDKEVGSRFRTLRKSMGLSLRDVAKEIGMSFTFLGDLERGDKAFKLRYIEHLAEFYNVPSTLITDHRVPLDHIELIGSILAELSGESEEMLQAFLAMLQARR